jgi:Integrase core domain
VYGPKFITPSKELGKPTGDRLRREVNTLRQEKEISRKALRSSSPERRSQRLVSDFRLGIVPSIGRTGTALDNAMAQSFVANLKTELLVHRRRFPDQDLAWSVIIEYLEGFYNRRRLHSALSYRSPAYYEESTMEGVAVA